MRLVPPLSLWWQKVSPPLKTCLGAFSPPLLKNVGAHVYDFDTFHMWRTVICPVEGDGGVSDDFFVQYSQLPKKRKVISQIKKLEFG